MCFSYIQRISPKNNKYRELANNTKAPIKKKHLPHSQIIKCINCQYQMPLSSLKKMIIYLDGDFIFSLALLLRHS